MDTKKDKTLDAFENQRMVQRKNVPDPEAIKDMDLWLSKFIARNGKLDARLQHTAWASYISRLRSRFKAHDEKLLAKYKDVMSDIIEHKNKNAQIIVKPKIGKKSNKSKVEQMVDLVDVESPSFEDLPETPDELTGPESFLKKEKKVFDKERKKFIDLVEETGCELQSVAFSRVFFDNFDKYHERAIEVIRNELDIDYNALLAYDELLQRQAAQLQAMEPIPFDEILPRLKQLIPAFEVYRNNMMIILSQSGYLDLSTIKDQFSNK